MNAKTEQLQQMLEAIRERDPELFVKGKKGYVKLNIQSETIENDQENFNCISCNGAWDGKVSKVSIVYDEDVQKGRICIPCTDIIVKFHEEFPTLINVIKPVKLTTKEELGEIVKKAIKEEKSDIDKKFDEVFDETTKKKPVSVRRYHPKFSKPVIMPPKKRWTGHVSLVPFPAYNPENDFELSRFNLTRRDALLICLMAEKNLGYMNEYMFSYFDINNKTRFSVHLENGRNISYKQARQISIAYDILELEGLLTKNKKGKIVQA